MKPPIPVPAVRVQLSPSLALIAAAKGPVSFLRGREAFTLAETEWARLRAYCAATDHEEGDA